MDKRKLLGTIIGILLFALCVTGISYAYYSWKSNETEVSLTIEDVKFEFLTDSSVNATNIGPILDYKDSNYYTEENKNKYLVYTDFIVDNQINKKYYINISLNINSIDISLINQSFKYVLLKGDDDSYDYNSPVSEGNFSNFTLGKNSIITNLEIEAKSKYLYRFVIYIDGNIYNDNNMMNGELNSNLELVSSKSKFTYVENLYNDGGVINTVNIGGNSSKPKVSLSDDTGIMLDNNGDYRYYGSNPNNYVNFNDELWRIISISEVEDENGNTEKRMKIIRSESIGQFSYDNKTSGLGTSDSDDGSNDWSDARLMMLLNPGYENPSNIYSYEGSLYWNKKSGTCYYGQNNATIDCDFTIKGLNSIAKNMINRSKFYLGGGGWGSTSGLYADDYYISERDNDVWDGHATTWLGYIGLMYPSDYGYATDLSVCTSDMFNYNTSGCYDNDWLYLGSVYQWMLAPTSNISSKVFYIHTAGYVQGYNNACFVREIRPTLYLKTNVNIVSGSGTSDNPYQLSLE